MNKEELADALKKNALTAVQIEEEFNISKSLTSSYVKRGYLVPIFTNNNLNLFYRKDIEKMSEKFQENSKIYKNTIDSLKKM